MPPNTPTNTPSKPKAIEGTEISASGLVQMAKAEMVNLMARVKVKGLEVVGEHLPTVPPWAVQFAGWGKEWWRAERVSKVVEGFVPRRELDAVVIEGQLVFCIRRRD